MSAATFLRAFARARWLARRFRSREELEAWQDRRAARHLAWVAARAPHTARRLAEHGAPLAGGGWRTLPPITKADVLAHFAAVNTAGVGLSDALAVAERAEATRDFAPTLGELTVGLSTGTSGQRSVFLASPAERAEWAGTVLARALQGPLLRRRRVALLLRAGGPLYESVGRGPLTFRFFDLLKDPRELARSLDAFGPDVLVAPPAALRLLAEAQRRGEIALRPEQVTSCADVLGDDDAAEITAAWGRPPHQIYQATEGFLGATCAHGTLHLNEDAVAVQPEWLGATEGEARRFVPVLTDLRRRTQPFVRYRLDDVLVARAAPCPCGSVLRALDRVEGRADDVLRWPAGDGMRAVFPDFVRRAVAGAHPAVADYRVVQVGPAALRVALRLSPDAEADAPQRAVEAALGELARRLGCAPLAVTFVPFEALPPDVKRRRVRRAPGA